jgi:outer membrane protein OmpA-like peptidoglycan-associated protein
MITFILALNLISSVQNASAFTVRRYCRILFLGLIFGGGGVSASTVPSSITYATRLDAVAWVFDGAKFSCQINHNIDDFGTAMFERKAGGSTRFFLQSQSPRMKSGKADLISQPPPWLASEPAVTLSAVEVKHGETPVTVKRKVSERMLAELQKGMDLHIVRQPLYGDKSSLIVVVPSVGFGDTYGDYLTCLRNLLPVNFSQIEKRSLYYGGIEELKPATTKYLQQVATYVKEDPAVKVVYIDGHTDSVGVRADNLEKSKERATLIVNYLIENGVLPDMIVARWHGERYQVATNQTSKGRAKNRRVTVRLSKEPPHNTMGASKSKAGTPSEGVGSASMGALSDN